MTKRVTFALVDHVLVLLCDLVAFELGVLEDFAEYGGFDVSELWSGVFIAEQFTNPSERPSDGGVEMVFDGVIGPEGYLKITCLRTV